MIEVPTVRTAFLNDRNLDMKAEGILAEEGEEDEDSVNEEEKSSSVKSEDSFVDDTELSFLQSLRKMYRDIKKDLVKEMQDYGPPYVEDAVLLPLSLISECAKVFPSHLKIHNLLNARANPNSPDKNDLNFTPLQWSVRRNHLKVVKMLFEAHVNPNAINELGHSALSLAVMFKAHSTKQKKDRFEIIKLIVANGAAIDHRDKGGFSALDFAVMNQDVDLVRFFLQNNVRVTLENAYLITKREPILSYARDPEVYRMVKEKLDAERFLIEEEERKAKEAQLKILEDARVAQAIKDAACKKTRQREARRNRLRALEEEKSRAKKVEIEAMLDVQMERYLKPPSNSTRIKISIGLIFLIFGFVS